MAVSKRSQTASKGFKVPEALGAEHQPTNHAGVGAQSAHSTARACVSACVRNGLLCACVRGWWHARARKATRCNATSLDAAQG
eukprot:8635457-Pyramimonas_sp.AAC.1